MNPAVDQSSTTKYVTDEKKIRCRNVRYDPGGGGINVSRVINILGGKTKAFYPAGGCMGDFLEELLEREHIHQSRFTINESTRVNIHILEESTNKQYRFNMPGTKIAENEWKTCLKLLEEYSPSPDFLVASGSLPLGVPDDFYARIGRFCHNIDCKFILDTSGKPLIQALDEGVYLMKPNLGEFTDLINEGIDKEQNIISKAKEIIQEGKSQIILISAGAAGSYVITKDFHEHIKSPLTPINSRIGAGDSMVAGVTLKLAQGETIKTAALYGVAAGSAAVITPGTELCRKDDVERLFKRMQNGKI